MDQGSVNSLCFLVKTRMRDKVMVTFAFWLSWVCRAKTSCCSVTSLSPPKSLCNHAHDQEREVLEF